MDSKTNNLKPESNIIPDFVSEWMEKKKKRHDNSLWSAISDLTKGDRLEDKEVQKWIFGSKTVKEMNKKEDLITNAWINGYEVDNSFEVKKGDWVIARDESVFDIRIVEDCNIGLNEPDAGILLVNQIRDESYVRADIEDFYNKYRLFVKKENVEI